jgi:hypothetical protein
VPVPYITIRKQDLDDPLCTNLNLVARTHTDELNRLGGLNGPVSIVSGLSVGDNQLGAGSLDVGGANVFSGAGNPNGVVAAPLGSMYLNTAGGAGQTIWVKESNNGGKTGWVAK